VNRVPPYLEQLWTQWGRSILQQIPHIAQSLIVVVLSFYVAGRAQRAVERIAGGDRRHRELARLLGRIIRVVVLFAGLLIVVSIFDQARLLASFLASLGIFGLLIAFALQDITKNFAAGVLLLIQRPFGLDDRIRFGVHEGTVTDISLRATVLRTVEGHEVLIPNADVFSGTITNLTRYPLRRHAVAVSLPVDVDAPATRATLEAALRRVPGIEPDPQPHVASTGLGKDDQQFEARFWIRSSAPETPAIVSATVFALQEAVQALRAAQQAKAEETLQVK
jgi:small-conductance mechanosensitive channel